MDMVFYLMEEVDGFNPGDSISERYSADAATRHESGLAVARALALQPGSHVKSRRRRARRRPS